MTAPEKPHLWRVIWAALDSRNPGDTCSGLLDTYTDLVADAVLKHFDKLVEDWQRNDEQVLADNQRLADDLARVQDELVTQNRLYRKVGAERDEKQFEIELLRRWVHRFRERAAEQREQIDRITKPNPWFTHPDEFPIETAEREDRERTSIGYAFPTQEWRQQQLDESPFVPPAITAMAKVRDRKAEALQQHHETVARIVEQYVTAAEPVADVRAYLLGKRREDCNILFGGKDSRAGDVIEPVRKLVEVPMINEATREQIKSALATAGKDMRELFLNGQWPESDVDERTEPKCCWAHAGPSAGLDLDAPTICTLLEESGP